MQLQVTGGKIFGGKNHQTDGEHLKKKKFSNILMCLQDSNRGRGRYGWGWPYSSYRGRRRWYNGSWISNLSSFMVVRNYRCGLCSLSSCKNYLKEKFLSSKANAI